MGAYQYIAKDLLTKKKYITVSDSLFEFDRNMAKLIMKDNYGSSFGEICSNNTTTTDNYIHQVSTKVTNPIHLLRFSKMEGKMIMAEIIDYRHFNQYSNIILTTIRFYLFRFDDKMRIDRVYSFNMQSE